MTGYLARLAARTGIGDDGARSANPAATPPPQTGDVVTFVTQPAGSAAPISPSTPDSRAVPIVSRAARPAARITIPDTPGAARAADPAPAPRLVNGEGEGEDVAATIDGPRAGEPAPLQATFVTPERPRADAPLALEAETLIATSTIAVPAASAAVRPRAMGPAAPPPFQPPAASDPAEAGPVSEPLGLEHVFAAAAAIPRAASPAAAPLAEQHPRFAPRQPAAPQWARTAPGPQAEPSVRIGSIQLDIHAAPPKPAPVPMLPRAPSLRRFYLRNW